MSDTKAILWASIEDYAGLWEAVWELRPLHRDADDGELLLIARREIDHLIDEGFIALYRTVEPDGEPQRISEQEYRPILEEARNWLAPDWDATAIRFGATPAGEAAYTAGQW